MSLLVGAAANSATGYTLDNSLRFRKSANAYLSRTPSSATNQKTWTWSGWVKRGSITDNGIFGIGTSGSSFCNIRFEPEYISVVNYVGGIQLELRTNALYRDPSAWYHIMFVLDTTESTASNRAKLYVNGEQVTSFLTATYPSLNADLLGNSTTPHYIGTLGNSTSVSLDGYEAEVNFVDGQALAPSDFGEYNEDTGVWQPKRYRGSYGTNGFYLKFGDTSSVAALGTDSSGNGNTWTVNNVSLTAGVTYDSMTDVPTLTDEDTSNFATRNPLAYSPSMTFSNGNLTTNGTLASWYGSASTIFVNSGKWYWETTITVKGTYAQIGVAEEDWTPNNSVGLQSNAYGYYSFNGNAVRDGASTAYGTTYTTGDVIGVALDYDSGAIWFSKNGTWQDGATISEVQAGTTTNAAFTGVTERLTPASSQYGTATQNHNFGQRAFAYTQPTGFKKLNTFNLPDSTIEDGSKYFDIRLRTGTGSEVTVSNLEFQPDLLWTKTRSNAVNHNLHSSLMSQNYSFLQSNTTNAENNSASTYYMTPTSTGYIVGSGDNINQNTYTFVDWLWKAGGGTGVSNGDGSITSTVSANTTAGFSVVTYGGNSTAGATVGHGLGVVPDMVIVKNRTGSSGFQNWGVYHSNLLNTQAVFLNTNGAVTANTTYWNNTTPTASVFSLGYTGTDGWNITGQNFIAYCFAKVEGYSKFGGYTGNGSSDGPFIYTGFRPAFVMIKRTDSTANWYIYDTSRGTSNAVIPFLNPNNSDAEQSFGAYDFLSNGFKNRQTNVFFNASGGSYMYMAFAENPFKNSNAR